MELANFLLLISTFQGFVLALLILFSPIFKSKANAYLGYAIGILSLMMLNLYLDNLEIFTSYPKLDVLSTIEWVFLFPVFFLFYVIHLIKHDLSKNKRLKWLYLPIVLSVLLHIIVHLEYTYSLYTLTFKAKVLLYDLVFGIEQLSTYFFTVGIFIWTRIILQKESKKNDTNVVWLKKLWFALCLVVLSWIILFITDLLIQVEDTQHNYYIDYYQYILDIELSLLVYWIAYTGLYKLRIANEREEILDLINKNDTTPIVMRVTEKDQKLALATDFSHNNPYFLKLESLFKDHHIYRDPDLTQDAVAEKLGISTGYLSQIINKVAQKNFKAYINGFRVQETKLMMLDKEFDKYSLLSLGLESGFNSKTTFYNAFKKEAGCTPNEFKNRHK